MDLTLEMPENEHQLSWRMDGTNGEEDTDHGGSRYLPM
jgi:hypothetical protein